MALKKRVPKKATSIYLDEKIYQFYKSKNLNISEIAAKYLKQNMKKIIKKDSLKKDDLT